MPATTPVYGITYPLPTDKVADGAAAIQSTAETVEAALVGVLPSIEVARVGALADVDLAEAEAVAAVGAVASVVTGYRRWFLIGGQ